jgi:hypothetical protein
MGNEDEDERVSQGNEPNWDINRAQGAQAELWVLDLCKTLAKGTGAVEVKAPKPFLRFQATKNEGPYVEYACCHDGKWRWSGIITTKAQVWFFTFGSLPGGLAVETQWLKRACKVAHAKGWQPSNQGCDCELRRLVGNARS